MQGVNIIVDSPSGILNYGVNQDAETKVEDNTEKLEYFLGVSGHISVDCPFMRTNPTNEKRIDHSLNDKLEQLARLLPESLVELYRHIGSSSQEIYIKYWTLFSIDSILERHAIIKKDDIEISDLGMRYCGMGHCKIAFYDPETKYIYYRADGGSNGWDRIDNYEKLKNYKSDINRMGLTFKKFIDEINTEVSESETPCIF